MLSVTAYSTRELIVD